MAEQEAPADHVTSASTTKLFLEACNDGSLSRTDAISFINHQDSSTKASALRKATDNGHFNVIRYLLEAEPSIDIDRNIALSAAQGGLHIYRLLHAKYPHIIEWEFGPWGTSGTALIVAIRIKDMELLYYILEHGGDPGRVPDVPSPRWAHKYSPIDVCAVDDNRDAAKMIVRYGATLEATEALNIAVTDGDVGLASFFIDLGCDVNFVRDSQDVSGIPPIKGGALHIAVKNGQLDMVLMLLAQGATPLVQDIKGMTAFDDARRATISEDLGLLEKAIEKTG